MTIAYVIKDLNSNWSKETHLKEEKLKIILKNIFYPEKDINILENGVVCGLTVRDLDAYVSIDASQLNSEQLIELKKEIENKFLSSREIDAVHISVTKHLKAKETQTVSGLNGISYIVGVASGKGGVGKSTTAVNLAIAFAQSGYKVGLLDADIYGPSLPRMMNLRNKPNVTEDKKLIPLKSYGVSCMSLGLMVPEESPLIWRGPMVQGALQQMLHDVAWTYHEGSLDILLIDMPPGTGDAHLTIAQKAELSGAVIISTPQDIALIDARKGLHMFEKVSVPVLGIIENMSQFLCPKCGEVSEIFGHGGARLEAERLGLPFLGEIPIELSIRLGCDQGLPVTSKDPESPINDCYRKIAGKIYDGLQKSRKKAPSIRIEN
jgi:ATP-binding protein involved in chromosome partitioning